MIVLRLNGVGFAETMEKRGRGDNFTLVGCKLIVGYYDEYYDCEHGYVEFDAIEQACEWEEFSSIEELQAAFIAYGYSEEKERFLKELEQETVVLFDKETGVYVIKPV